MAGSELAPNGVSPLEAEIGLGLDALHGALLAGLHGAVTQVVLPADRTAPTAARTVVGLCLGASLDARVLSDAQLLVSELVTNCLVHGALGDQDAIVIRLQLEAASLRLVVHHRGVAGTVACEGGDTDRGSGYGLELVGLLSRQWGVTQHEDTCVWVEMARS